MGPKPKSILHVFILIFILTLFRNLRTARWIFINFLPQSSVGFGLTRAMNGNSGKTYIFFLCGLFCTLIELLMKIRHSYNIVILQTYCHHFGIVILLLLENVFLPKFYKKTDCHHIHILICISLKFPIEIFWDMYIYNLEARNLKWDLFHF